MDIDIKGIGVLHRMGILPHLTLCLFNALAESDVNFTFKIKIVNVFIRCSPFKIKLIHFFSN